MRPAARFALERVQAHDRDAVAVEVHGLGVPRDLGVAAHADELAQEIEVAEIGAQREVQPGAQRGRVELERQPGRGVQHERDPAHDRVADVVPGQRLNDALELRRHRDPASALRAPRGPGASARAARSA
jgi:hypothetical protein